MNYIIEAHRYLDNAKELLRDKADKEDGLYKDKKYVKLAGHAAYTGLLLALDGYLQSNKKSRKSVDWYKEQLAKKDKKILERFNNAYELLHLFMGYDGAKSVNVANEGLNEAERIISWIETKQELVHN